MLKKIFIGCGVLIVAAIALMMVALIYIGAVSPSTRVRAGDQVRSKFVDELRELGMLEPDEELRYFYSDGLLSIREGSYVLTDRALVRPCGGEFDIWLLPAADSSLSPAAAAPALAGMHAGRRAPPICSGMSGACLSTQSRVFVSSTKHDPARH